MGRKAYSRRWAIVCLFFCFSAFAKNSVHRIIYSDDEMLKGDREILENVYGATLHVLPPEGEPPAKPEKVKGIVFHVDSDFDPDWVMGTHNPLLEYVKLLKKLHKQMGLKDIDEKWDEYRFLEQIAPSVMPPEMHLGSEFDPNRVTGAAREEIEKRVEGMLKTKKLKDITLEKALIKMECMRKLMNDKMGKSIFKVRDFNHSEGKLPKTNKDWADIYLNYYVTSRPKVLKIEKEVEGTSRSLEGEVVDLPFIEGRALDVLIEDPERTIVQRMIPIKTEMRMHIVEGQIVEGATFLRFYPFGKYLPHEEIQLAQKAVREEFLSQVVPRFGKFSCTPDVVIEESGKVRILDMNSSLQSGYYYPDEDIFTPNLMTAQLSGEKTTLLEEWDEVKAGKLDGDLMKRVRDFRVRYRAHINDYNEGAFWDRVLRLYMDELLADPTAERYAKALFQLSRSGLKTSSIFYQFVHEVQDRWPKMLLPDGQAEGWVKHFNKLDSDYKFKLTPAGLIDGEEVPEEAPKKKAAAK